MKPYDIIVALQLFVASEQERERPTLWMAKRLGLSTSRIHESLRRLHQNRIVDPKGNRVLTQHLFEFVEHGLRYVYPAEIGAITRGVPTASSAPPLAEVFVAGDVETRFVWPSAEGNERGAALEPLHRVVPSIALSDPEMYELLAVVDALRLSDPRVRGEASRALRKQLERAA